MASSNYNEFRIGNEVFLKSYDTIVAKWDTTTRQVTLGKFWDISTTTVTHVGMFLTNVAHRPEHGGKAIRKAIKDGTISLDETMK